MALFYVCRSFGSTLIIQIGPSGPIPTLVIIATFRDGDAPASYRDGMITVGGR